MSKGQTARMMARAEAGNAHAEAEARRQIRRLMGRGFTDAQIAARLGLPGLVAEERMVQLVARKRAALELARERAIVESEPAAVARVLRAGVMPSPNARYREPRRALQAVGGMLV